MTRISEAVECLEELGYTVTPPKVEVNLPTQPDWYSDKDGDVWRLDARRGWIYFLSGGTSTETHMSTVTSFAPFTKLEPASVAAKKVLDAVKGDIVPGAIDPDSARHFEACLNHVAQLFGVTD